MFSCLGWVHDVGSIPSRDMRQRPHLGENTILVEKREHIVPRAAGAVCAPFDPAPFTLHIRTLNVDTLFGGRTRTTSDIDMSV